MKQAQSTPDHKGEQEAVPCSSRWLRVDLFRLPIYFLLPSSLLFSILYDQMALASGGSDTPEFADGMIRWGMSGGATPFVLLMMIGSISWIFALAMWILLVKKERRVHWPQLTALLLGILFHPWIFGLIWDRFISSMIS